MHLHNFEEGATHKGLAQVHRADPGSIYFTLQEGTKNPTYTYRHVGGENWKAIPKKRKIKPEKVIVDIDVTGVKQAFVEIMKEANFGHDMNMLAGQMMSRTPDALKSIVMSPGESTNPLMPALLGGGAGLAYDLFKKKVYNTPEENENDGLNKTLLRTLTPALALGGASALERNAFKPYYNQVDLDGSRPSLFGHNGQPMTIPFIRPD